MPTIYTFDPTQSDEMSRVRGIGRYLEILKEAFGEEWKFVGDINMTPEGAIFINPFFNFLSSPTPLPRKTKNIAVIHDLIPLKYPAHFPVGLRGKLNIFRNKQILKKYDVIVTDSQESKKNIVKLLSIDEEKIRVVYPTVGNIFTKKNTDVNLDAVQIPDTFCLYVGDATWNKNLVTLARAIKELDIACVFVGKVFKTEDSLDHPWQSELKGFLEETAGDKRFIFPGFVQDDMLVQLYRKARCNILVSEDEGFGFSFLEAAAVGTPSVLSDIPVFHETAAASALFANTSNHTEIAHAIKQLCSDKNLRETIAQKALERSMFFSMKKFKDNFNEILKA